MFWFLRFGGKLLERVCTPSDAGLLTGEWRCGILDDGVAGCWGLFPARDGGEKSSSQFSSWGLVGARGVSAMDDAAGITCVLVVNALRTSANALSRSGLGLVGMR